MASLGTGSGSSSQQSYVDPVQTRYLQQLYEDSSRIGAYQYGPGRVSGFNENQNQAFDLARDRAVGGSATMRGAESELQRTLAGDYLNPDSNPALAEYARRAGENFRGEVNALGSSMESMGRTGSGAHQVGNDRAQRNLSQGLANLYGGAYEAERGRMAGAVGQAGMFAENDYRDINALASVGAQQQGQSQRFLDDVVARYQFGQDRNYQALERRKAILGNPTILQTGTSKNSETSFGLGG